MYKGGFVNHRFQNISTEYSFRSLSNIQFLFLYRFYENDNFIHIVPGNYRVNLNIKQE
jgi:hypothetical protein